MAWQIIRCRKGLCIFLQDCEFLSKRVNLIQSLKTVPGWNGITSDVILMGKKKTLRREPSWQISHTQIMNSAIFDLYGQRNEIKKKLVILVFEKKLHSRLLSYLTDKGNVINVKMCHQKPVNKVFLWVDLVT